MDEAELQRALDRLRNGDESAGESLLALTFARLRLLADKMFHDFPRLKRHLETDDVLQAAALRLDRALKASRPETIQAYYRLAATQIRRELFDLSRQIFGAHGPGKRHSSNVFYDENNQPVWHVEQTPEDHHESHELARWTHFHREIARLPDKERDVFDLLYYQGLSQAEAAALLKVSVRTIKARWQSARKQLQQALGREPHFLDD